MPPPLHRPVTYREEDLFGPASLPLYTSVAELDGPLEAHAHDFLEVAVVGSGTGRHVTSSGATAAKVGDVFVLRPGAWHAFEDCQSLVVANCCVGTSNLAGTAGNLALLQELPELRELLWLGPVTGGRQGALATSVSVDTARVAIAEIRRLAADLRRQDVNRVLLMSRLLTILGRLVDPDGRLSDARPVRPRLVDAVVQLMDSVPERQWTVAQLAGEVNIDPAYLSRLFRQHIGLPPIGYLARLRTERASVLLARTDLPIAQVGAAVGWAEPSYFARRFRALSGLTPTAYRERILSSAS